MSTMFVLLGQMEKLDWTVFFRGVFFLGWGGCIKKSRFQPFPNRLYFFLCGGGEVGKGVVLYRLYSSLLFVGFVLSVIFRLGGRLRLVALFDSRPSRFT